MKFPTLPLLHLVLFCSINLQARVLKFPLFAEIDRNDIINRSNRCYHNSRHSCIPFVVVAVSSGRTSICNRTAYDFVSDRWNSPILVVPAFPSPSSHLAVEHL
ncbi:hypothetical protein ACS0TY_006099 [Phlomoides rotata]